MLLENGVCMVNTSLELCKGFIFNFNKVFCHSQWENKWNPQEVNVLEVNSRLKSMLHGDPDFFLLCLSNFISLKVKDLGPILG